MARKPAADQPRNLNQTKKPYHPPEVIVYGDIREITRNVGPRGPLDNAGGAGAGPKTGK